MKFEASHYDTVEWNPKLLRAGKMFYKPEKTGKVKIGNKKIFEIPFELDIFNWNL